jgi:hypothetical protein
MIVFLARHYSDAKESHALVILSATATIAEHTKGELRNFRK